ncbi:LPS export ABC transporter permease LptF [Plastorhodobacter daqingensis]|uniref:LPS export ABC transporter permease LptF n=1 Tax=Plastorhodobacter daqingensis TaxID=1387281 RepID=A0ABW2UM54_9RHOB
MSRFDRYMLSQLMTVFGFFALVLVSVYWVNRAVALFDQLLGDGQTALVFLEISALTLPNVIRLVLPVASFAAAVFVTNRLSTDSELVVMQATGFSSFRLARPVLMFGLVVALLMSVLTHYLVPASRSTLAERQGEIAENITARLLVEGQFLHPAEGITLYIREILPSGELRDIYLSDARSPRSRTTYSARAAYVVRGDSGPVLVMVDGLAQTLRAEGQRLFTTRFGDLTYDIGALVSVGGRGRLDARELPTLALFNPSETLLEETRQSRAFFLHEAHSRFAQPMLAAVSALIGFGTLLLGGFSRFGVWRQMLLAVVLLVLVQMVANVASGMALRDERLAALAWAPVLAGGAIAVLVLWLSIRPRRVRPPRPPQGPPQNPRRGLHGGATA